MPERPGLEPTPSGELEKEAIIRRAEESYTEVRELSALLDTARRWVRSAETPEAHEAVYRAAGAQGNAVLGATLELERGTPIDLGAVWREVAREEIEAVRQMLPEFSD
jgi:hypothetical protein